MSKKFKDTKFGKLLKNAAPVAANVVAEFIPDVGFLGVVKNLISNEPGITPASRNLLNEALLDFEKTELVEIMKDKSDARDMQKVALQQDDLFSKRYIYYLATFWSIIAALYIFSITFFDILNARVADTILGFLMGTIISSIMGFFFGSSQGSKDKTKAMAKPQ